MPETTRDRCITPSFSPSTYPRGKLMDGEDLDLTSETTRKDRQDRRRDAGAHAAGPQAGRTAGLRYGAGPDTRGRRSPPALPRAQGADGRTHLACQSDQGTAICPGGPRLRTAAP